MARNAAYRELLTGIDAEAAASVGDSIETLTELQVTPRRGRAGPCGRRPRGSGAAGLEAPSGREPRAGPARRSVAAGARADPDLLARVEALPPIRDRLVLDVEREARPDPGFSMRGLISEFRWPFALGLLLVVLDAFAALLGPWLVHTGIDDGVSAGSTRVLWLASAAFLVVVLVDLVDQVAETFVTGRTSQRIMAGLRIRIWAQLQRLSLDYYEREMAGRIMTRMTTDVDQFEALVENGLLAALVSLVTFVGVGVALLLLDVELALWTLLVVIPLAVATIIFRRITNRLYDAVRESLAVVNADFQESLSGIREAQAFAHEVPTVERFHALGLRYLEARLEGAAADRDVLPVRAVPVRHRRRDRARRRRPPDRGGQADDRRADRVHPLPDDVLLPDPAAVAGLRLLAADPRVGQPHLRPHAPADPDARAGGAGRARGRPRGAGPGRRALPLPDGGGGRPREVRGPADAALPETDVVRRRPPRRCAGSTSACAPARPWPSSARPAPGSRRCSSCSPGSTTPTPAR